MYYRRATSTGRDADGFHRPGRLSATGRRRASGSRRAPHAPVRPCWRPSCATASSCARRSRIGGRRARATPTRPAVLVKPARFGRSVDTAARQRDRRARTRDRGAGVDDDPAPAGLVSARCVVPRGGPSVDATWWMPSRSIDSTYVKTPGPRIDEGTGRWHGEGCSPRRWHRRVAGAHAQATGQARPSAPRVFKVSCRRHDGHAGQPAHPTTFDELSRSAMRAPSTR